jgi:hypothetical protein
MKLDLVFDELLPHPVEAVWRSDGWPAKIASLRRSLD